MRAWFVSDIHIKTACDSNLARFEAFLDARLADATTHLFLVGDIFDLWVGSDQFFAKRYSGVVDRIKKLRALGVDIFYFEGNHDLHLADFWQRVLDVTVVSAPRYFTVGNYRVRVEHGDQMNPNDRGYLFLRWLLRTPVLTFTIKLVPGRFIQLIGSGMSCVSRTWTRNLEADSQRTTSIVSMIRTHAKLAYKNEPFDIIISGHVHKRDDFEFDIDNKKVRSINLGTWLQQPDTKMPRPTEGFVIDGEGARWVAIS